MKLISSIIISLYCLTSIVQSQVVSDNYFTNLKSEQALAKAVIYSIKQDQLGFMWLGTDKGLYRYDGKHFKYYEVFDSSAKQNKIKSILCGSSGKIWIGPKEGGLICFDPITLKHTDYTTDEQKKKSFFYIMDLYQDGDDSIIWIAGSMGLLQFNTKTLAYNKIILVDTIFDKNIRSLTKIYKDNEGILWIASIDGLIRMSHANNQNYTFKSFQGDHFSDLIRDQNGFLWISSFSNGLFKFDPKHWRIIDSFNSLSTTGNKIPTNSIETIYLDKINRLWIAGNSGDLAFIDLENNKVIQISQGSELQRGYTGFSHISIGYSKDGIIWFGSRGEGLNKMVSVASHKYHYSKEFANNQTKNNLYVINIRASNNKIFARLVGDQILEYDPKYEKATINTYHRLYASNGFEINNSGETVFCVNGRLAYLDNKSNHPIKLDLNNESYPTLVGLWKDMYLINSKQKHYLFNQKTGKLIDKFERKNNQKIAILNDKLFFIRDTLFSYSDGSLNIEYFSNQTDSLIIKAVGVYNDSIYILTNKNILRIFNHKEKQIYKFINHENIKPLRPVMYIDANENIWFIDDQLLYRFVRPIQRLLYYNIDKYYANSSLQLTPSLIINDTLMAIGGRNGINVINPQLLELDTFLYNLRITEITISDRPFRGSYYDDVINLRLEPNQNSIIIEFCFLNYKFPEAFEYSYIMEGQENETVDLNQSNIISLRHLSPGKYNITPKARDANGNWHIGPTVSIVILPPIYLRPWFIIGILIITILSIGGYVNYRNRKFREQNKWLGEQVKIRTIEILEKNEEMRVQNEHIESQKAELEKLNATKDKLFSIIAHDLKNPFHSISGFCTLLLNNFDDYSNEQKIELLKLIDSSVHNAAQLLENLLYWSRTNLNKISYKPKMNDINDVINDNIKLLKPYAHNKTITLSSLDLSFIAYFDRDMITTVIRNLVTNSIKFTPSGGSISINAIKRDHQLIVSIVDSGVGMNEAKIKSLFNFGESKSTQGTEGEQGTGIGLLLCFEFVQRNSGEIKIKSEVGKGTSFSFNLPIEPSKDID